MKQQITKEQASELLKLEGRHKIIEFITSRDDIQRISYEHVDLGGVHCLKSLPILSIGQMMEFLGEDHFDALYDKPKNKHGNVFEWEKGEEPCDVLWEDVKNKLKNG